MPAPTSLRLEQAVTDRLAEYVATHPGTSRSSVAARYVDEGLRMEQHPGIVFREGPAGRRAVVIGGPDVWEVVRTLQQLRAASPDLSEEALLAVLDEVYGVAPRLARLAVDYWTAYPSEVEARIALAARTEADLVARAERADGLLKA